MGNDQSRVDTSIAGTMTLVEICFLVRSKVRCQIYEEG